MLNFLIFFTTALYVSSPINGVQFESTNQDFQGPQRNCSYSTEIETKCTLSAETRDHVSVKFSNSKGNLLIMKHSKNPKLSYAPKNGLKNQGGAYGGFGRCAIDIFEASGPCVSDEVCSLYLKKVSSDEWRPGWVKIHQHEGGNLTCSMLENLCPKMCGMVSIIVIPKGTICHLTPLSVKTNDVCW